MEVSHSLTRKKNSGFLSREGRVSRPRTWQPFNDPTLESQGGFFCRARLSRAEAPGGQEGSGASPESTPEAAGLHAPGNFPGGQQGRRGRRFPSAPRAPRARGSGRAAGAAATASSRPRLRRAASSLRPARPPGSLPSWQAPAAAAAAAADGEGVRLPRGVGDEAREVSRGRSSVRPPARPLTPHAASWRSRAARPCTSSFPSRRPR